MVEAEEEDTNADKKDSVVEVMKMNSPEWPHILIGCIGAIVMGCAMPVFAVLFGSILGVSIVYTKITNLEIIIHIFSRHYHWEKRMK